MLSVSYVRRRPGDMGLDSLQGRRDIEKLKWWYKYQSIGIQGSFLCRSEMSSHVEVGKESMLTIWFSSLGLDKEEWLKDIRK